MVSTIKLTMKGFSLTYVDVYTLLLIVAITLQKAASNGEKSINNKRMHEVVRSMLGFANSPNMSDYSLNSAEDAPKYMLDLYERFTNGPMELRGNTVRSVQAKKDIVREEPMFVFNLTALESTRQIISAEIHVYKRRKARHNKRAKLELAMFEIAPNHVRESDKVTLDVEKFGWQILDVTQTVKNCLHEKLDHPYFLGLNFKITKSHGSFNLLKLKRFMHHRSTPYLIVYSNDSQDIELPELDKLKSIESKGSPTVLLDEETKVHSMDTVLPERTKRTRRSVVDNSADIPIFKSHARSMSILTNEIPEDPDAEYRRYPINFNLKTHPGMLQTRKESRHRLPNTRLIPYPGEFTEGKSRKRWRNRRRKHRNGRKKNKLKLPKEWEDLRKMAEEDSPSNLCSRKKLVVDFNDIGWGEWVISPKSFKAHYCAGSCPFPLTKKLRPSNHATIQSLVNAVGIHTDVPAPCCVPDKLSSITLLYFDENRNVVLKNYPNMTVQKCACR